MRFTKMFSRFKPAVAPQIAIGADAAPTAAPDGSVKGPDNVIVGPFSNVSGWPCHRIAVVHNYIGAGPAVAVTADLFFWEELTQAWYKISAAPKTITTGVVAFFDCVGLLETAHIQGNLDRPTSGSQGVFLRVLDPGGLPNGQYDFAVGFDLTTTP